MIYHPWSAHSNGGASGSRRNGPVSAAHCVSFRFGLGRKYDISPPGAVTSPTVGCLRLQAPASLLPQMDESPPFHEIALEYLQNDLFPLSLSPRCINSFHTRREDAMRAALPPGPRATPHAPFAVTASPTGSPPSETPSPEVPLQRDRKGEGTEAPTGWRQDHDPGLAGCKASAFPRPGARCVSPAVACVPFPLNWSNSSPFSFCPCGSSGCGSVPAPRCLSRCTLHLGGYSACEPGTVPGGWTRGRLLL